MAFFSGLGELRASEGTLKNPSRWLQDWFGGGALTKAGTRVTEANALKLWAAHACVNLLSRTVGQLGCITYERLMPRGRNRAHDHYNYEKLHLRPNPEMSAVSFFRTLTAHRETWGNSYGLMDVDGRGRITAIWPVAPHRVHPERAPNTKALRYRVTLPNGQDQFVPPELMLHVPGLGYDGVVGYNRIEMARELLGKGFALEEFTSRFFSQGTHAGLVISHDQNLGQEGRESLEKSLATDYAGLGKSHKILLLEESMKVEKVGFPPQQSQFIETQELTLRQICGFWSVPPYMLGLQDKEPKASTEQKGLEFLVYTMGALLVAWEQEINWKMYTPAERRRYYSEFLVDSILRATIKERFEAYKTARYGGWMDGNEIRERENLNPREGLDEPWMPVNMIPASLAETYLLTAKGNPDKTERSALPADTLRDQYLPLLEERLGTLVRREVADVKSAARKMLAEDGDSTFRSWLDDYYGEHPLRIQNRLAAIAESLDVASGGGVDVERCADDWSRISHATLLSALDASTSAEANPYGTVTERLDQWFASRAGSAAPGMLSNLLNPPEN
ncbi:MAG: phage portal protein [bacterium]|nr:phage portal protein [bacterium]